MCCLYSLEAPELLFWGASNEYLHVFVEKKKKEKYLPNNPSYLQLCV